MASTSPTKGITGQKEPLNQVERNAVLCETIRKEQRHQQLYTNYGLNSQNVKKIHKISGKPNSSHDTEEGEEDVTFRQELKRAFEVNNVKIHFCNIWLDYFV